MRTLAPVLMIQGTASSVGKSTLAAGVCRLLAREGLNVAPFKAQNMSNNAAVTACGEIGRAQFVQALAARVEPTVDMNPVLLKPQPGGWQTVIHGRVVTAPPADLWPVVTEALDRLRSTYDIVIAEGAGSPAEINLRDQDIVNMRLALSVQAHVLLVADIDRGGAFASLLGTWEWLQPEEQKLVHGFILNKFRGDAALLAPAPRLLEQRTGVPVLGVVPFLSELGIAEEDAASLEQRAVDAATVEVAVVRFPHLANFDEFGALALEARVHVRYVTRPEELRAPDLVVLPGTKATIADLHWLKQSGLAARIRWLVADDTPLIGICGGYQMLGRRLTDPLHLESDLTSGDGLGFFAFDTDLQAEKTLACTSGVVGPGLTGVWCALHGVAVQGYEIHAGRSESRPEGVLDVTSSGRVVGTYVHGCFEMPEFRQRLIRELARKRGFEWSPVATPDDPFDRLADAIQAGVGHTSCLLPRR